MVVFGILNVDGRDRTTAPVVGLALIWFAVPVTDATAAEPEHDAHANDVVPVLRRQSPDPTGAARMLNLLASE